MTQVREQKRVRQSHASRTALIVLFVAAASGAIANPTPLSPGVAHQTMSDAERAAVIADAVNTPMERSATAREHKMLRISPSEARATIDRATRTDSSQRKSLATVDNTFRESRHGDAVTLVVGTALATRMKVQRDAKGRLIESCSEDHDHSSHRAVSGGNRE
jgi:hypothetical protein